MDSIILAGGFAKRMWPLTKNKPKQLLDVAGKPMLSHVIDSLTKISPNRIIVSVNSFFESQFKSYLSSHDLPSNVELYVEKSSSEEEKLGALGALDLLFKEFSIKGPVFIAGGDNLSNFNLRDMVSVFEETKKDVIGLYDVEDINLAKFALKNSIKDFEFFVGIPGTIGGAVKMNAGCYGSQTSDNLKRILVLNSQGRVQYIDLKELNLEYRSSKLDKKSIILQADFNFDHSTYDEILKKNNYIKLKRENTQPLKEKTSGSTFKNPPDKFAAELIEKVGCKGLKVGDASVSNIHANFIINNGTATATDIEKLGKKVIKRVKEEFGISLEWEIKILGK